MEFSKIKSEIIGKSLEAALQLIKGAGLRHRIVAENGVRHQLTMDYCIDRVNLTIDGGVVTDADNG
jgi:hypothetical protein